jgi:hydrophobic/amphiphilic exporter-1 (mainly G- bacteria), HAE1 family
MSFLTRLSLANRGLVALIAIVITGFGVYAIPALKQQLLPSLEFPGAFIGASLPGAGPEIIEQQITVPIENAITGSRASPPPPARAPRRSRSTSSSVRTSTPPSTS